MIGTPERSLDGEKMNTILRNAITKLAEKAGYTIIPTWRMKGLDFSNYLASLFHHYAIDCVFDVGANKGQYGSFLRQHVGFTGTILSFEPVEKNISALKTETAVDPKWFVYGHALGSENTRSRLNVMKSDVFSSFLTPVHDDVTAFKGQNEIDHVEVVEVKRLDDIVESLRQAHPFTNVYLKLDTQGHDLEVVKGAGAALQYVKCLQSEISMRKIYRDMPDYTTSLEVFEDLGYVVSNMFPVTIVDFEAIEFDCVMVRHKGTVQEV